MAGIPKDAFVVMLQHEPTAWRRTILPKTEAQITLSGHTHGGQLIPLGPIGRLLGANDRTYGTETRGNTTFIVTSGISDWEIRFKTGTKSEYVVIDIVSESRR